MSVQAIADVWRFAPKKLLTSGELLLLLELADAVDDEHRMAWESVATMARKIGVTERSIYNGINKLTKLNILALVPEEEWPPAAFRYVSAVRRLRPVEDWSSDTEVDNVPTENFSGVNAASDNSSTNTNTSSHKGDFVSLTRSGKAEPRRTKRPKVDPDEGLDHQKLVLDSWDDLESHADPPSVPTRNPPGPDTATGLVAYFASKLVKVGADWHAGLQPANYRVMGRALAEWKRNGVTPDTIRTMIDVYCSEPAFRDSRVIPWKDFLAKRKALAVRVDSRLQNQAMEDHRYDMDYWQ